jgi:hypothetical protein
MRIVKAAAACVAIAMLVGTVLGTVRELLLLRHIGLEAALALETPVMLAVCAWSVHWAVRRFAVPARLPPRVAMGTLLLAMQLGAEELLTRAAWGTSVFERWATFGPLASAINAFGLAVFAALPALLLAASRPPSPTRA